MAKHIESVFFGMSDEEYESKKPIVKHAMSVTMSLDIPLGKEGQIYIGSIILDGLKEQDRIARQEERERCIKAAREAVIEELSDDIRVDAGDVAQGVENILRRKFRKAIKEGGNI